MAKFFAEIVFQYPVGDLSLIMKVRGWPAFSLLPLPPRLTQELEVRLIGVPIFILQESVGNQAD
ncbi:hypothetical protein CEB3_c28710 [Peptococcaceae bacterium CEB3]|nr:hypothetical protein CEB3_c28710 [Peptococcaceae bacterium CEB3]